MIYHSNYVYVYCGLWVDRDYFGLFTFFLQMIGEFQGDSGHINCLVWSAKAALLYAGDSNGVLGVWHQKEGAWRLKHKTDIMNVKFAWYGSSC